MFKLCISLILLSIFTLNTQAASLPQEASTGVDGAFDLLSDDTLFSNISHIYNFTDFNIGEGATLNIDNNGPVYIYSEQSITINGALTSNSSDLHLIAPNMTVSNITVGNLSVYAIGGNTLLIDTAPNGNGVTIGNGLTLTTGTTDTITTGDISLIAVDPILTLTPINNIGTITLITSPSPVPLPGALWLMMSGIISFGLLKRRPQKR